MVFTAEALASPYCEDRANADKASSNQASKPAMSGFSSFLGSLLYMRQLSRGDPPPQPPPSPWRWLLPPMVKYTDADV
ncbi:hypothetical protein LTR39_004481, partial [Cryomyces antarcticus]